ncbi:polysaccharide deacetylase family protein [Candidatus Woesearchaeota archaeon]|nr:polysaccharide deacetylase family protein [Candidatus Woesearchaeota archaeon]
MKIPNKTKSKIIKVKTTNKNKIKNYEKVHYYNVPIRPNEKKTTKLEKIILDNKINDKSKKIKKYVPILMYHEIGNSNEYSPRYVVSPNMFKKHLNALYEDNFVSISLDEYITGTYKHILKGKKPMIITFDDATIGQFRYITNNEGEKIIDPDCGVGIMQTFSKKNPDFRMKAAFFIDYVNKVGNFEVPFKQNGYEINKINDLIDMGFDIGSHTLEHVNLKNATKKEMNNQIEFLNYIVNLIKPDYKIKSLAEPFGAMPTTKKGKKLIKQNFEYAFAAWGGVARDINSKKFNKYAIPRIEINNDFKNLNMYVLK